MSGSQGIEAEIVQFGPYRVIGLNYIGKNENMEIPALWHGEGGFISRMGEIEALPGDCISFGLCRCVPDATDGSFEYIAALPAKPDAPIPSGMVEASIPACTYAVFEVECLAELSQAWVKIPIWLQEHPEWKGYCIGPDECDCANHPNFELYPADFTPTGKLYVYVPVQAAG